MRLSIHMKEMLEDFQKSRYGELYITPAGRRTAQALVDRSLIRWLPTGGYHEWARITDAGKAKDCSA